MKHLEITINLLQCLDTSDFYELTKRLVRSRNNKFVTMPKLADIFSVQFRKDESKMFYKTDFTAQYLFVEFLQQKFINTNGHTSFPQTINRKKRYHPKKGKMVYLQF